MPNSIAPICLFCFFNIFPASAQNYADCATAFPLGDRTFLHFIGNKGIGQVDDAPYVPCFVNGQNQGHAEKNSTWIAFNIKSPGNLSFIITPHTMIDDIDFVVFLLPKNGNYKHKKIVRCMAAGDSQDIDKSPCMGKTGLYKTEDDTKEDAGCSDIGDNNWLSPLEVDAGEKYVLLVSNITAPRGFTIYFKGSAVLEPGASIREVEKKE